MLQSSRHSLSLIFDVICPTEVLMYTIWYVKNQVCFKGIILDVFHALNLVKIQQKSYNLTIYQSYKPPTTRRQDQVHNLPSSDLDCTINNHLWLKGIRKCSRRTKRSMIKSVLIYKAKSLRLVVIGIRVILQQIIFSRKL